MIPATVRRRTYSKLPDVMELPDLLDVQLKSFKDFLQKDVPPEKRKNQGLQEVFNDIFPIKDTHENFSLEFLGYSVGEPKYAVADCQERGITYSAPLKVKMRLVIREEMEDGTKRLRDIIEQDVYLCDIPMMTESGTFIINGAERVIVNQLHRSPGVFFSEETHPNGKKLFSAKIIPFRGSWIEFKIDVNDVMYMYIDKKRKLPVSTLLRGIGYSTDDEIYNIFKKSEQVELVVEREQERERKRGRKKKGNLTSPCIGRISADDLIDERTGELLIEANEVIDSSHLENIVSAGLVSVKGEEDDENQPQKSKQSAPFYLSLISQDSTKHLEIIRNTINKDISASKEDALSHIYSLVRPGSTLSTDAARDFVEKFFFNPKRYNLARVGRYKLNRRLGIKDVPEDVTVLTPQDFIKTINYLLGLYNGNGYVDDIDHLGNRRVRTVCELLSNQFSIGLSRMVRIIKERMSLQEADTLTPYDLVNARTVSAVINTFFGSSQLSQFMDQVNPLAELTHKRRLSALGPGGLTRERAGFEVRDVHHTHYGRMCPIETPEGPNIGLITSLCTYTRINDFGFLETPYRRVDDTKVTNKIEYLPADVEDENIIAQANAQVSEDGKLLPTQLLARYKGDFPMPKPEEVKYIDVSPKQMVSVAASLIPFLEHDDANRALMGSNMQRQAVPLLNPQAPLVGTGMEYRTAVDSKAVVVAKRAGLVEGVSADQIIINTSISKSGKQNYDIPFDKMFDYYKLTKFKRTNQDTCIDQRPLVKVGDYVEKGQVIADGMATDGGELALGTNLLVAFMPWGGYNFEDAILVSEKLIKDDVFTSIHIKEVEVQVRDTKRGCEEITREIPNVSEESTRNLDENGLVRIGAEVKEGDVLVGKVTPKGEIELTPEERLLRAIFGDKAGDVTDASLKVQPGQEGIVIGVRVFSRKGHSDKLKRENEKMLENLKKQCDMEIRFLKRMRDKAIKELVMGRTSIDLYKKHSNNVVVEGKKKITPEFYEQYLEGKLDKLDLSDGIVKESDVNEKVKSILISAEQSIEAIKSKVDEGKEQIEKGDELPAGVIQLVKVYIAQKRKLSVGDKVAGRHGNKGVVGKILAVEDMPYLADGTPVDIVLNPLGVPSRMNVGQILETHLGWAAKELGAKIKIELDRIKQLDKMLATYQGKTEDEKDENESQSNKNFIESDTSNEGKEEFTTLPDLGENYRIPVPEYIYPKEDIKEPKEIEKERKDCIARIRTWLKIGYGKQLDSYMNIDKASEHDIINFASSVQNGIPMASPVFDGPSYGEIQKILQEVGLPVNGKVKLYDGRTGEPFGNDVTVGCIYMLKLCHLVDDKVHARSTGPYSLVTQQPLGGKAQFGGQRFGEMEVWALEAHGAAYTIQEFLTVKSDDITGRSKVYEAIIKGEPLPEPGIPESFNVLVKELKGLGLDIELEEV